MRFRSSSMLTEVRVFISILHAELESVNRMDRQHKVQGTRALQWGASTGQVDRESGFLAWNAGTDGGGWGQAGPLEGILPAIRLGTSWMWCLTACSTASGSPVRIASTIGRC